MASSDFRVLRGSEVRRITGLSRSQVWRLEHLGDFPRRLVLGPNSVGWLESEVCEWIRSRARAQLGGEEGRAA